MTRLMASVYERFMDTTERACLREWRAALLSSARGEVLEIGAGTGLNLEHYPSAIERLVVTEPDPHMRAQLDRNVRSRTENRAVEVSDASALDLPFDDATFDTVVSTLVLCSVPNLHQTLGEVHRVLRPGGSFLFLEHVAAAHGTSRRRWQGRLEPAWKWVAGGCHLTRETEDAIARSGLVPRDPTRESMRKAPPWVRPTVRGIAVKPATDA